MATAKSKILNKVNRKYNATRALYKDFKAYDDIFDLKWEIPWAAQPWVRKRVSSVGHNAMKSVMNLFNTYNPKWEILPRGPADKETAEALERWLEWQMSQTNTKGAQEPFRKMLKSTAMKSVIAAQMDYLPYWLADGEERKQLLMNGAFCINVHEPNESNRILYEIGKYGLRWVAQVSLMTSADIIDLWEQYESGDSKLKYALAKVRAEVDGADEDEVFLYVDYTDKDMRWVFCSLTDNMEVGMIVDENRIDILDTKNKLPFINWVITEASGDPLFKSMHYSGSWENQNFFETLSDSSVIRRAYFPLLKHTSNTGEDLDVDFTGPEAVLKVRAGDQAEVMQPPPFDPGIRELQDRNAANMGNDLGVKGIQNTDITGNVQFATVNAQIQLGKTVLDPHIRAFERACVQLAKLSFYWVKELGDTVTSYRTKSKGKNVQGEKININGGMYDPNTLMITCELLANTPNDDMQRWNIFSGMKQAGLQIPDSEFVERMEMGDPAILAERWLDQEMSKFALDLFKQQKMAEMQMMVQQAAQAAQQAAAAAAAEPPGDPNAPQGQPAFDQTQGQGFDPSQGGSSPAEAAPSITQSVTRK